MIKDALFNQQASLAYLQFYSSLALPSASQTLMSELTFLLMMRDCNASPSKAFKVSDPYILRQVLDLRQMLLLLSTFRLAAQHLHRRIRTSSYLSSIRLLHKVHSKHHKHVFSHFSPISKAKCFFQLLNEFLIFSYEEISLRINLHLLHHLNLIKLHSNLLTLTSHYFSSVTLLDHQQHPYKQFLLSYKQVLVL